MKKIILILLLVILVGCGGTAETTTSEKSPFVGGTVGLLIVFEEDAPPAEVYDGGDFPFGVVVKLSNEGEYTIPKEKVDVRISGILASEFNKVEADFVKNPDEDLEATKKDAEGTVVESTPVFVEFEDFNHVNDLTGNTQYTIRADICYGYGTTANSKICVREDNLETDEGVCEVNEDKRVFSSGGPVQVKDFKETTRAKDKVAFTFSIEHKGNGLIYQKESKCENTRTMEDKIWVEVETGLSGLECSGLRDGTANTGFVTLYGNEKPITCTQTVSTTSDYEKPVVVRLVYDYKDSKEETLLVKHSLG